MSESVPAEIEEERNDAEEHTPMAYAVEEAEATEEEESSTSDEAMRMELFNSKDSAEPWTRRVYALPVKKAVSVWRKAMEASIAPESKKAVCVAMVTAVAQAQDSTAHKEGCIEEVIEEGVKRDGAVFLKKCIDNTRNMQDIVLYRHLCERYIREKKDAVYGYRELLNCAMKEKSKEILQSVRRTVTDNASSIKTVDKKEIELACIDVEYALSKDEARVSIEKVLAGTENKNKHEWAVRYIALEIGGIASQADIKYTRNLLERTIHTMGLSTSAVKGMFKTYLKFEKEYGTQETEEKVLEMAKAYVQQI